MKSKKKVVVFTGAGMSADSGVSTFRDADGLWENHRIEDVCTPEAWARNPQMVLDFYNARRAQLDQVQPNAGHRAVAELEKHFERVVVVTQNVDDLHERAGSSHVLHLHGELMKVRSMTHPERVYDVRDITGGGIETSLSTRDPYGDPVRPHIVFFQEAVPNFAPAAELVQEADIFVVIGTSLVVYPAASLISYVRKGVPIYYIDPNPADTGTLPVTVIREKATEGVRKLAEILRTSH